MKKFILLLAASLFSQTAAAQCYQNGIPCSLGPSGTTGNATTMMGTDGTTTVPVVTDSQGHLIVSRSALPEGNNTIGSVKSIVNPVNVLGDFYPTVQSVSQSGGWNTSLTGLLPAFASIPTFNLGSLNGAATSAKQDLILTTLGSPLQSGGLIGNTAFGISGTLPPFASAPTVNIGSAPVISTYPQGFVVSGAQSYVAGVYRQFTLTPGGALRTDSSGSVQPVSGSVTANIGTTNGLALDSSVSGLFKSGQSIGNTAFGAKLQDATGAAFGTALNPVYVSGGSGTPTGSPGIPNTNVVTVQGVVNGTGVTVTNAGTFAVQNTAAIPTGANTIGNVNVNGTVPVTGTFYQAIQPVSQSGGWNVGISGSLPSFASTPTFNVGTIGGIATDSSLQTLNTTIGQRTDLAATTTDATATSLIAQSKQTVVKLNNLITNLGSPLQANGNIGTVSSITNPVAVTGTFYQSTQPVSAASLPLPTGAATSALQTSMGTQLGSIVTNTTGASTASNQVTGNNYLATIATNTAQPAGSGVTTWNNSGSISALNGTFELVSPGAGSAVIAVSSSNFIGTLSVYGCADASCSVLGGRLLFKSGIGSTGTNTITLNGSTVSREYRVVGGGNRFRVVATSYTSGTVNINMLAQSSSNIVFVNGPVHTAEEEALRQGRAYTASTGVTAVSTGNYLNAKLCNPANSGINMFITMRKYNSNITGGNTPLEFQTVGNPTTVPLTTGTITNRYVGGGASSATFQYQMMSTQLAGGTLGSSGFITTNGEGDTILVTGVLTQGQCTGVSIGGGGGGLAAAARVSATFVWYEENAN